MQSFHLGEACLVVFFSIPLLILSLCHFLRQAFPGHVPMSFYQNFPHYACSLE